MLSGAESRELAAYPYPPAVHAAFTWYSPRPDWLRRDQSGRDETITLSVDIEPGRRVAQIKIKEGIPEQRGHRPVAVPLPVGGYDVPGRHGRRTP